MPQRPYAIKEGDLVPLRDIPSVVRAAREASGLTTAQAATALGVSEVVLEQAESQPHRWRFRLRKRIVERFTGLTLEGPYYRVRCQHRP